MMKPLLHFSTFTLISFLFSNCTFMRTVRYFRPSTLDHEKVFACDTVRGLAPPNYASSDNIPWAVNEVFVNENNPNNIPKLTQWIPPVYRMESRTLDEFLQKTATTSFLLIKNDTILYEKYLNGGSIEQPRIVFSVTKAFVATLTAIASEEGYLDINQKVADFIPEFGKDNRRDISLKHLMDMTSGLDWMDYDNVIKLGFLYYTKDQTKFIIKYAKLKHQPGTVHAYKSLSTQILGICLERATGKSIADYLEEKIWKPLDMPHDAFVTLDSKKEQNPRAFGGMAMTARSMARFGKLLLDNGQWKGKQLIPAWFVNKLTQRDISNSNWCNDVLCFKGNVYEDINYKEEQRYLASGFMGQYLFVDPKNKMLVVRQGNRERTKWKMFLGRLTTLVGEGRNDLTDKSMDFGQQFAGDYISKEGLKMSFISQGKDEYQRRNWEWERDIKVFPYHKKLESLAQYDGVSIGHKHRGHYTRIFFDIKDQKIIGLYYVKSPAIQALYFKKIN